MTLRAEESVEEVTVACRRIAAVRIHEPDESHHSA